jgi:uncharacterized membrane protein YgcG
MDPQLQITTGSQTGSPDEAPEFGPRRRMLPVVLAVVVLAPGVLLAAPLKHAFANFMVGANPDATAVDEEPVGDGGGAHRRADALHRHAAGSTGAGRATHVPAAASPWARVGMLKLADLQTDILNSSDDADATLVGDGGGDDLMSKRRDPISADLTSGSFVMSGHSQGGGFGGGLDAGGGGGGSGGRAAPARSETAGLGNSTPGPDTLTDDPSLLGTAPGALSGAPEPAAWISLILGFGLTGAVLRRRTGQAGISAQR